MANKRITSVDIFRGMTIAFMILVNTPGTWSHIYPPLEHAKWHGITPTDWIFPFFLFIVGVSITLAYHKKREYLDFNPYKKIFTRSLKIILIGLLLAGFKYKFPFFRDLSTLRFPGVLQRIGLVFFISAIIFTNIKNWRYYILITTLILGGYWFGMTQININGEKPQLTKTHNLASVIDIKVLGTNHMWSQAKGEYDPEGLFSSIPAVATTLLGILLGLILVNRKIYPYAKIVIFIGIGILLWLFGWLWSFYFPLNKSLWTSSYVLYTAGLAYIFFGIIYMISDVFNYKKWSNIFIYLGSNAIAVFTLSVFIAKSFYLLKFPGSKSGIHSYLYKNIFVKAIGESNEISSVLYAISVIIFYIFVARWLYKNKIFIKV